MNHNYTAKYKNIVLRPLMHDDIEHLRVWRNDRHATRFLRQIGHITPEMQEKWFETYLGNNKEITFAIVETERIGGIVGSISIYDIEGDTAEFGKLQIGEQRAHGMKIGSIATAMALAVAFDKIGITRIVGCVHRENIAAHKSYMRIGFKITGEQPAAVGGMEDLIEIDKETLLRVNDYAKDFILED